jgi:hypothetical protein
MKRRDASKAQFLGGDFQCGIRAGFELIDAVFVIIEAYNWPFFPNSAASGSPT